MLSILMALAAVQAQPATPPATAAAPTARTLQTLPGTTVQYYDVAGRNAGAIQKDLDRILKLPPPNNTAAQGYNWNLGMSINRRTEGTVCTVTKATAELKANVFLPRLTEESRVPGEELASFKAWSNGLEKTAAQNLWFVVDRLPALQQSLVGKPCDQAQTAWTAAVDNLIKEQNAYAQSLKTAEDAAAAAAAPKGKVKKSGNNRNDDANNAIKSQY
jgi:hypothetical protein